MHFVEAAKDDELKLTVINEGYSVYVKANHERDDQQVSPKRGHKCENCSVIARCANSVKDRFHYNSLTVASRVPRSKSVVSVVSCRFPNSIATTCCQQIDNKLATSLSMNVILRAVSCILYIRNHFLSVYSCRFSIWNNVGPKLACTISKYGIRDAVWQSFLPRDASAERGNATVSCPSVCNV